MLTATGDVHNYMQQCDLIKTSTDDSLAVTGAEFYINFFWYRWMWMSPEIDLWSSYNNIISTVKSIIIPTPFSITDTRQLIRIIYKTLLATNYITIIIVMRNHLEILPRSKANRSIDRWRSSNPHPVHEIGGQLVCDARPEDQPNVVLGHFLL